MPRFYADSAIEVAKEDIIDWVKINLDPGDVFNDYELIEWAKDNGFVEEEE